MSSRTLDAIIPTPEGTIVTVTHGDTDTREYVETRLSEDKDESSHIVLHPKGAGDETPQSYILRARIEGFPVKALCGYEWIPKRDPLPLPVCATCMDLYQQPGKHRDERDNLPES